MLRYANLILCAVAYLAISAGISIRGYADDDQKPASGKAPPAKGGSGAKQPPLLGAEKYEKYDLGDIEEAPPPVLDVDPTLEKPAAPQVQRRGGGVPAASGGTKKTERAVTAALIWLANHQNFVDGNWSLQHYTANCKPGDKSCTGRCIIPAADVGATAMGLLPFLAAGQTQKSKGPFKEHISRAVDWLIKQQQPDGNLAEGAHQMMYSHGLATLALSEDYGMTGDKRVGAAVEKAVKFIVDAQNAQDGGWRYNPGDAGDTSVLGWQISALQSAKRAGIRIPPNVFSSASKFLDSVSSDNGAKYCYQPGVPAMPPMTAIGLLSRQYLGAKHDNPMLTGGVKYLMEFLPDEEARNIYYWYFGTQFMHNMQGQDWEAWNAKMRDILVRTQVRDDTCAKGSWDPKKDAWGPHGGRVMMTSLSALTLEVYHRYLPLFKPEAAPTAKRE
jgi:hypothetical protein